MRPLNEIRHYMGSYPLKSGAYHYDRGEFAQAIGFLRKAVRDDTVSEPERRSARSYLTLALKGHAHKLAGAGELEAALEQLERATEINPGYPDLHYLTGHVLEQSGRTDEAVAAYGRAIESHPAYLDAHVALAYCLTRNGRLEDAARAFDSALAVKQGQLRRPFEAGLERLSAGDGNAALDAFHDVFLAAPELAEVYLAKALEWYRLEEFERALDDFDRALELNPGYPDLHNHRGLVLYALDRVEDAIEAFRRSTQLGPSHLVPRLNLAFALLAAGHPEQACETLQSVLRDHPGEPVATAKLEELAASPPPERRGQGARG